MAFDAADFETNDIRDARPDQIGDGYKASVVDALDEEAHTLGADCRSMPRSFLIIERSELERASRGQATRRAA